MVFKNSPTRNISFQVQITSFAIARILLRSRVDLLSQMPLLVASTNGVAHNPTPVTLLGDSNALILNSPWLIVLKRSWPPSTRPSGTKKFVTVFYYTLKEEPTKPKQRKNEDKIVACKCLWVHEAQVLYLLIQCRLNMNISHGSCAVYGDLYAWKDVLRVMNFPLVFIPPR